MPEPNCSDCKHEEDTPENRLICTQCMVDFMLAGELGKFEPKPDINDIEA